MAAAGTKARATGQPVAVDALTTESTQVVAQPGGGFAVNSSAKPVRTEQNGRWMAVDTTLHRGPDGRLAPAATAYGSVRFSGGGNGPLVETVSGGTTYRVSWPSELPVPKVDGSSATYPEVLPDVDLVLSPTVSGGFSEVLVVKSARAAKDSRLASLRLPTAVSGGTLTGAAGRGAAVEAAPHGPVLDIGSAVMWDSGLDARVGQSDGAVRPLTAQEAAAARIAPDPSDTKHPGAAAKIAVVGVSVREDALTLTPDRGLLGDPATVFPVYVDPTFNWHPADGGTPAFDEVKQGSPCNGVSLYNHTDSAGDYGNLGVGVNGWGGCQGAMRAYYQWNLPSSIWGADINSATVNATKVYSAACGESPTVMLHWAGAIGSGTDWNNQSGYGGTISSSQFGPSYNPQYCPGNGSVSHGLDVTWPIGQQAANHKDSFTVALTEDGYESSHNVNGFSRFSDNPSLQIFFNLHPGTPGSSDLSAVSGSANAGCATSTPYPFMGKTVATSTPVLKARISDPNGDSLRATFKYWVDGSGTTATGLSGDGLGSGSTADYSLPSSFTGSLTNGQTVAWQVQVTDGASTSDWSPVCHFTAVPTGPDSPTIPPNPVFPNTDNGGGTGAAAGTGATFTVHGAADGAPATKFIYGLDQVPATSGTPASQIAPATGTVGSAPAGRWKLTDGSGATASDTGGNHPATLTGGASFTTGDTVRGGAMNLNGTGFAATNGPVLTTTSSYSVSTWVRLGDTSGYHTFVAQGGANAAAFYLQYSPGFGGYTFVSASSDSASPAAYYSAHLSSTPALNTWTHLVGVFDATNGAMRLYVNGTLAATGNNPAPWNATGPLALGAARFSGGGATDYTKGSLADAQVYARALTDVEVNSIYSSADIRVLPQAAGPHTLWTAGVDAAGDVSGMTAYRFLAAGHANTTCSSFAACRDNTAISPDSDPALGSADGDYSMSATDLANAGWGSGQRVTVNGATFTLPAYGSGQADNVLAANQTIAYNQALPAGSTSSLVMLASSTNVNLADPGAVIGAAAPYVPAGTGVSGTYCFDSTNPSAYCPASGVITYSDGSTQTYALTVPDWVTGPTSLAAVVLPHRNSPSGQVSQKAKIYPFSVPLAAGKTMVSVTLPDVATKPYLPALHVFGMSTRNTTVGTAKADGTTANTAAGTSWTGAWANPTEGSYNFQGADFSNQTFRIALKPSISGNTVRIKLDNALGTTSLNIGHATIALSSGSPSATPAGAVTSLTFGGVQGTVVPVGGMVYSDPLPFTVTADQYLLVSFSLTNSVPYLVEHSWANTAYSYLSAHGSGDHTTDTSATAFSGTGTYQGWFTDALTDVDVTTSNIPTQAVLGDGLIDAWQPNTSPIGQNALRLSDDLAAAEPSAPNPFGSIAEGIESNQVMKDDPETHNNGSVGGPSVLSRIDRDILSQPGLNSVVLLEGLEDVLNGRTAQDLNANGYTQLLSYLQASGVNVTAIGLTPCDGYTGDGATGNSANDPCTGTVDGYRTTVNRWLSDGMFGMNAWSSPALYYIDPDTVLGTPDSANGETRLNPDAAISDHVNLTTAAHGALTTAILGAQDTWPLNDGTTGTANDTSAPFGPYPTAGQSPLALNGTYTWPTDATRGTVLALDGATGYGETSGPVLDTTRSYTVTAWVKPTDLTDNSTFVSQSGTNAYGMQLSYSNGAHAFAFGRASANDTTASSSTAYGPSSGTGAPQTGDWVHLAGVYTAANHQLQLYVNGTLAATASSAGADWSATGPLEIGRLLYKGSNGEYANGSISDVQTWNYSLTAPQVTALYRQITPVR
ncbi:LamG-like jellyroll fold domain-containing protein [Kitasatospora sp. NPDC088783]|uniref:LamG-like jellyroll fold domain-containing protein n=1 Tax=Kitasatospora sp. NPDC088783 TaxID=3364077 RepID=UPI00381CFB5E